MHTLYYSLPVSDSHLSLIVYLSSPFPSIPQTTATYPISVTLSSLSPVSPTLNCTASSPVMDTLNYSSTISQATATSGYLTIDSTCLSASAMYQLSLTHTGPSVLLIDSVSI